VSIDELERGYSGPPRGGFDRTPPQDVAAEQSVLGGMMISKDAIADVVEQLRGTDFYRPAHEAVYDAILDLYGRGEPADAVTVAAELTKRGEMSRIGGAPYLHTLISMVPTAANAGYYARIVRERAVLRRLVQAGTRIVQLGYATEGGDVDEIVNNAQAEVYAVTEQRSSEDYLRLGDVIGGTVDEIEAAGHRGEGMIGVPTGFADLDRLTNGLHPGQMVVLAARPAIGKALALDTPLPTPTGWTRMGDVRVGDALFAADGTATRVVGVTEVMVDRDCYAVTFDDGTTIVADAQHEWETTTRVSRRTAGRTAQILTTVQLLAATAANAATAGTTGTTGTPSVVATAVTPAGSAESRSDPQGDHAVDVALALHLPEVSLPLHPYALGVWLGDGHPGSSRCTSVDPQVQMRLEGLGLVARPAGRPDGAPSYDLELPPGAPGPVADILRAVGVLTDKHIPAPYLRASRAQRRELLAGLLDTRGSVSSSGDVQIEVPSPRLAPDVRELLHSLGYRLTSSVSTRIAFAAADDVFTVERKLLAHKDLRPASTTRDTLRFVVSVNRVASVPVRCVEVDHRDHLYLAGRAMVPTHNSTLGLDIARSASIKHNLTSVIFSLEMSRNEITMRLLSAEAKIHLQKMRNGTMGEDDWQRLAGTMGKISEAPLFIDDSPNMSLMEIRAKCRRLKQKHDLKLVIIDYLQLMSSGKRVESRQQEVSEFSRALKLLAKELEVPVVAISQLNRGAEQRNDKRPAMSDLRESGSIEQDADIVILLHREDAYERESPRAGEADLIVAKHRNGPTDVITVAFQGHYSRFVDMQNN
jgi:replicative DNA helicase